MKLTNRKTIQNKSKTKELLLKETKTTKKVNFDYELKWDCEA